MQKVKLTVCVLTLVTVLSGCASRPVVQSCPKPPPPPASLMQSAPDMMQSLNAIISVSSNESDNLKQ
ncbi:Rz1 protein [Hafnia phage Pocitis76]|nr:Rz1 protein [Hafnia phage Pocitis76]